MLGSASPDLLRQTSETLAGRISYLELDDFALDEVGFEEADRLWLRGRFPRSFLSPSAVDSFEWRRRFVRTFLERDLPALGVQVPGPTGLEQIDVIHAGEHTFALAEGIRAVAFARLFTDVEPL